MSASSPTMSKPNITPTSDDQENEVDLLKLIANSNFNSYPLLIIDHNEYCGYPIYDEYDDDGFIIRVISMNKDQDTLSTLYWPTSNTHLTGLLLV